jgi:beta-alanine degradation protein BauB
MGNTRREDELGNIGTELLFENQKIRVWQMLLAPGESSPLHRHLHDYVWVDLTPTSTETLGPFSPTLLTHHDGFVQYNVVGRGGRTYDSGIKNAGTTTVRQIVIEFLGDSASEKPLSPETNGRGDPSPAFDTQAKQT